MQTSLVDLARLAELTDGNREEMRELLELYYQQTEAQIADLHEAVTANNALRVSQLAHSCAGASLTCGITSVADPLRKLEAASRSGDLVEASRTVDLAQAQLQQVRNFFEFYFK